MRTACARKARRSNGDRWIGELWRPSKQERVMALLRSCSHVQDGEAPAPYCRMNYTEKEIILVFMKTNMWGRVGKQATPLLQCRHAAHRTHSGSGTIRSREREAHNRALCDSAAMGCLHVALSCQTRNIALYDRDELPDLIESSQEGPDGDGLSPCCIVLPDAQFCLV
jgi:hypothetical protein